MAKRIANLPRGNPQFGKSAELEIEPAVSQAQAAEMLNVGENTTMTSDTMTATPAPETTPHRNRFLRLCAITETPQTIVLPAEVCGTTLADQLVAVALDGQQGRRDANLKALCRDIHFRDGYRSARLDTDWSFDELRKLVSRARIQLAKLSSENAERQEKRDELTTLLNAK